MPGLKLPLTKLSTMFVAMLALSGKLPAIAVGLALLLVSAAAITLAAGNSDLANLIVIYAFGFFAAGVIMYIIQYIRESIKSPEDNDNASN